MKRLGLRVVRACIKLALQAVRRDENAGAINGDSPIRQVGATFGEHFAPVDVADPRPHGD